MNSMISSVRILSGIGLMLLAAMVGGCGGDDNPTESTVEQTLVGLWQATSIEEFPSGNHISAKGSDPIVKFLFEETQEGAYFFYWSQVMEYRRDFQWVETEPGKIEISYFILPPENYLYEFRFSGQNLILERTIQDEGGATLERTTLRRVEQ